MSPRRAACCLCLLVAFALHGQVANADDDYVDRADVIAAEPIYAVTDDPDCDTGAVRNARLGDQRRLHPGVTLGRVLRGPTTSGGRCRPVDRRIVAYNVTFRYQGETWTRRMDHDPGDSIRVRVQLRDSHAGSRVVSSSN